LLDDSVQDAFAAVHASPYTPSKKATPSGIKRDQVRTLLSSLTCARNLQLDFCT
jgi:hypothetical protein